MKKACKYKSKVPDKDGIVHWNKSENKIWHDLYVQQIEKISDKACCEYLDGMKLLNLPQDRIPQLQDVSKILKESTGWVIEAVPSLINFDRFFELLANRHFPCATFIRRREEFLYLQEPDIFHEIFGHCPLLTNKHFADFTARYGQIGLNATHKERVMLARLYWFTVEFGLIRRNNQMKIYGGGILSSIGETDWCLGPEVERKHLNLMEALRTPYRIDIMQPIYYFIEDFAEFEELTTEEILNAVHKAMDLGLFEPKYTPKSA
ncbi:MAG: phenylalanine 4-monooxygenase [Lentisphaeraceae bacterium]|nr:phenylalanine 4-monooxygenase [Lentisphaeraceae bacterium]